MTSICKAPKHLHADLIKRQVWLGRKNISGHNLRRKLDPTYRPVRL